MKLKIVDPSDLALQSFRIEGFHNEAPNAETLAMLQALYSRSPASVEQHLEKVFKEGAKAFMETYYIGYGHESIGQCASITLFIEGVSFLAAKAIQSDPYYNGQESSTRYMDFSNATWTNPFPCEETEALFEESIRWYKKIFEQTYESLCWSVEKSSEDSELVIERTLKAKAFDVARGFLPIGLHTNLSWHGTLDGIRKHLKVLAVSPVEEVRYIAKTIWRELSLKYEGTFPKDLYKNEKEKAYYILQSNLQYIDIDPQEDQSVYKNNSLFMYALSEELLSERQRGQRIPRAFDMYGDIEQTFTLDYGSFRDLQRHRHGVMIMPLASSFELNDFYEQYLTGELKLEFWKFTQDRKETLASLQEYEGFSQENLQHYHLLGENVNFRMKFALPQAVYIAELRSQQTVHPTLRKLAQELGRDIERFFPEVNLFVNYDPDELCFKRGKQTIEEKK